MNRDHHIREFCTVWLVIFILASLSAATANKHVHPRVSLHIRYTIYRFIHIVWQQGGQILSNQNRYEDTQRLSACEPIQASDTTPRSASIFNGTQDNSLQ